MKQLNKPETATLRLTPDQVELVMLAVSAMVETETVDGALNDLLRRAYAEVLATIRTQYDFEMEKGVRK